MFHFFPTKHAVCRVACAPDACQRRPRRVVGLDRGGGIPCQKPTKTWQKHGVSARTPCIHVYMYTYIYTYVYTYIYTYIYLYMYTYVIIYTYMYLCDYSAKMQIQVLMVWINNRNLNCQCNMFFQCLPITKRTSNRFLWSRDFWYPDNSTSSCIVSSCSIAEGSILGHKLLLSVLRIHHRLIQGWFFMAI